MSKPYSWEEVRSFLVKKLEKSKSIMTWGTIGSCNIEHDIDTIITKKLEAKSSDFYKEVYAIFDSLNLYLKNKYGSNLLRFPGGWMQELINLSDYSKIDLVIESMIYTSYAEIQKDWAWAMFKDESLKDLLKGQNFLIGSANDLFSLGFSRERFSCPIFIYIYHYDRIHSCYSNKILIDLANHNYDYLYRKRLGLKSPVIKNVKDIRQALYNLCEVLDKLDIKNNL